MTIENVVFGVSSSNTNVIHGGIEFDNAILYKIFRADITVCHKYKSSWSSIQLITKIGNVLIKTLLPNINYINESETTVL